MKRIGLLTSGGDAPGMNTAIRAVVRSADALGLETLGIRDGYHGLIQQRVQCLSARDVGDILHRGGTILRTARCPDMYTPEGLDAARRSLAELRVDGLVVVGGDGSLAGAHTLGSGNVPVVGIPASIDNDIWGTRMSLGVDSALNTIMDAIDKIRDTASSHQRTFLIETMGRSSGYLAAMAGLICGAELVVARERGVDLEEVGEVVARAYARGKPHCFVIVAEGSPLCIDDIAKHLVSHGIGFESRVTKLGHIQRGGSPSAFDRMLASKMGVRAVQALLDGETDVMTGLEGWDIGTVDLADVCAREGDHGVPYMELASLLAR